MKAIFKFTVIALGIAAVALSVVAIANLCKEKYFCREDGEFGLIDD
jgi:hypothetical protein